MLGHLQRTLSILFSTMPQKIVTCIPRIPATLSAWNPIFNASGFERTFVIVTAFDATRQNRGTISFFFFFFFLSWFLVVLDFDADDDNDARSSSSSSVVVGRRRRVPSVLGCCCCCCCLVSFLDFWRRRGGAFLRQNQSF